MANRRMISRDISVSEKTNKLSDFAALLFSWMIPHADDYGIIAGSASKIKALVIPMRKQTEKQVETALKEMQEVGLIWRYAYLDKEYSQFCNWDEHQEGLHKRTKAKNPCYANVKHDSGNFREIPGNSRLIEQNRTEKKRIEKEYNAPGNSDEKKGDDKSTVQFTEFVSLTNDEYSSLVAKLGEHGAIRCVELLDNYKGAHGKKYKSDYRAILMWVVDKYNEEYKKGVAPPAESTAETAWQEVINNLDPCKIPKWSSDKIKNAIVKMGKRILYDPAIPIEQKRQEFIRAWGDG